MSETSYKAMLCLRIIEQHFGDITSQVAAQLLAHPNSSLRAILQYLRFHSQIAPSTHIHNRLYSKTSHSSALTSEMIRKSLIVMQQHNCIRVSKHTMEENEELRPLLYSLNMEMVVNRLRIPKMIQICHQKYGKIGEMIMEEVLLHGRIQLCTLKIDVAERLHQVDEKQHEHSDSTNGNRAAIQSKEQRFDESKQQIVQVFQEMVEARLLVRVDTVEKGTKMVDVEIAKGSMDKVLSGTKRKAPSNQAGRGRGRGRGSLTIDAALRTAGDDSVAEEASSIEDCVVMAGAPRYLYGICMYDQCFTGWDQYFRVIRVNLCTSLAKDRTDDDSGRVVKTILEASKDFTVNQNKSAALPLNEIQDRVDLKMDIKRLQKLLDDMTNDPVQIIDKVWLTLVHFE